MRNKYAAIALALVIASQSAAYAQSRDGPLVLVEANDSQAAITERERHDAAGDEIRALVYSPEFIMAYRREISLSDQQRDQMVADLQALQRRLIAEQDQMSDARAALIQALRAEPANETRVLAALDDVLSIEREVKRLQLQALLRLRDSLTPSQRARLSELRSER
jgi:hypothetical protein